MDLGPGILQPQLGIYCNVTEALKTSNIKTVLLILRTIDEEKTRIQKVLRIAYISNSKH